VTTATNSSIVAVAANLNQKKLSESMATPDDIPLFRDVFTTRGTEICGKMMN